MITASLIICPFHFILIVISVVDDMSDNYTPAVKMCPQWDKADGTQIGYYQKLLDAKLLSVKCSLFNSEVANNSHLLVIDKYYDDIMAVIKFSSTKAINS